MPDFKLQQSQRAQLSAQQILSSQLLQLPLLNLEQRIYDELQENPLLELIEEKNESVDETGEQSGDDGDDGDGEGMFDSVDRFDARDEKPPEKNEQPKESQEGVLHFTVDTTPKENFIQAIQQDSFEERMLKDLSLREEIGSTELLIASEILGNLDDDGYLQDGLDIVGDGLLTNHGVDVEPRDIQRVQHIIQRMDPPGIAVASLRERLLVQLELKQAAAGSGGAAIIAKKLLDSYFDDFLNNRYEKIIKRMQIRPEQLEAAIKEIAALDPHPFVVYQDTGDYIMPDFIVTYENGRLTAALNDRSNLSVQVSDAYRDVLKNRKIPRGDKQFVRQKLNRAKEFASAIEQRRHTLLSVIGALMQFQYEFFVSGPSMLVPLGMKDVAEKSGFDLSTISRAVNGKYVQTRFGTFELKYFFSGGTTTDEGEELSTKIVKQYLQEMVSAEDSKKPLSDDRLAQMLEEKGIRIARRTVAKYREQMQIPVARLRKKIF